MKSILIILLIFHSTLVKSQFNVYGKIYQQEVPLANATVVLQNTFYQTASKSDGSFEFKNLKSGNYILWLSYLGFETFTSNLLLSKDTFLNFTLIRSSVLSNEVVVTSTRSGANNFAVSKLSKPELEQKNFVQDVPYLLNQIPSVVITSDAGAGVGYTGIRIRGSDASRINVTINGIPINDAESQNVYWVDLPDIVSSVENIQVQRGVGGSTNGAGAFGGSINVLTNALNTEGYAQTSNSMGSFNTFKNNIALGSGLLNNHWSIEGRLSRIKSNGYIDRGSSDLKSYYASAGYLSKKTLVRFNIFSGHEVTYQSWNGVPEVRVNNDIAGINDFIASNYLDDEDASNLINSGRNYNSFTYNNQVDDYNQDHYQLLFAQEISNSLQLNIAGHFTKGKGFYEEYKKQQNFSDYNLPYVILSTDTITTTNIIRRKWLDNDFYGITYSLNYDANKKLKVNIGGAWNQYDGDHYSEIVWAQYASTSSIRYRYETDNALKTDFNMYGKVNYSITNKLDVFCDLQTRTVTYQFNGINDELSMVPKKDELNFFNPKAGILFRINNLNTLYASASVGNKEPSRGDYVDHIIKPKPESMIDYEIGYRYSSKKISAAINIYYMDYKNQLVATGQLNDVGNAIRSNVEKSYREGVEIEFKYNLTTKISIDANTTFSKNRIASFTEYIDDWDTYVQRDFKYEKVTIAYSPSVISAVALSWKPLKGLQLQLIEKYVDKQFLDNTQNDKRSLKAYQTLDARINYTLEKVITREINFGLLLNNVLDAKYSSNGYTYPHFASNQLYSDNYLYPQAGFNLLGQITIKF